LYLCRTRGQSPKIRCIEVAGVVEDGKYDSLTEDRQGAVFFPLAQATDTETTLIVRSQMPDADTASAVHRIITGIDPGLPFTISSWPTALGLVLFPARVAAASLGIMGLLAAMLAITGTFGVAAYSVSKRMRELGIRVALGAHRIQLMRSALGRPIRSANLGFDRWLGARHARQPLPCPDRLSGHLT
jgi:hypothetical protein